jgi:hypothetical protein
MNSDTQATLAELANEMSPDEIESAEKAADETLARIEAEGLSPEEAIVRITENIVDTIDKTAETMSTLMTSTPPPVYAEEVRENLNSLAWKERQDGNYIKSIMTTEASRQLGGAATMVPLLKPTTNQGWEVEGWKRKPIFKKAKEAAFDKMARSKRYKFLPLTGLEGKVRSVLPQTHKSLANAVCYRLYTYIAATDLESCAITASTIIERIYASFKGKDPEAIFLLTVVAESCKKKN